MNQNGEREKDKLQRETAIEREAERYHNGEGTTSI